MNIRNRMTISMFVLAHIVLFWSFMAGQFIVRVVLDTSQFSPFVSGLISGLPGAMFGAYLLWSIKLPDGRYLFRQWEGDNLKFATPPQIALFYLITFAAFSPLFYRLFWY
jgi:hypothetical protein